MKENDRIIIDYFNDFLDSILKIKSSLRNIDYPTFQENLKTQYAVIRALEIIGEVSKKILTEVNDHYSRIPLRFMAGMRNKLIHDLNFSAGFS